MYLTDHQGGALYQSIVLSKTDNPLIPGAAQHYIQLNNHQIVVLSRGLRCDQAFANGARTSFSQYLTVPSQDNLEETRKMFTMEVRFKASRGQGSLDVKIFRQEGSDLEPILSLQLSKCYTGDMSAFLRSEIGAISQTRDMNIRVSGFQISPRTRNSFLHKRVASSPEEADAANPSNNEALANPSNNEELPNPSSNDEELPNPSSNEELANPSNDEESANF
jgi:hypothetical protein